ncbi:cytosine permease [Alicyclobacillus curvatus]|nr:cytosine permease [Alicyclobacillus curvatus]
MTNDRNGNVPWRIERNGMNPIPVDEQTGRPNELFWIWFAANLGLLGLLYGAILVNYHLNFVQALLAAVLSALSFLLVGVLSVSGRNSGLPMFAVSRRVFGRLGNLPLVFISWVNLLGWESVTAITATLSLTALLQTWFGFPSGILATSVSLLMFLLLTGSFGLLGHATLVIVQRLAAWVLGGFTAVIGVFLLAASNWSTVFQQPTSAWIGNFLPATSILVAGTGISWVNVAADYSRYQSRRYPRSALISAVTVGAGIPLVSLILIGFLVSVGHPEIASSANPVLALGQRLPPWLMVPYLVTVVGGLAAETDLSLYSSGLNLLVLGVRVARYKTIFMDTIVMLGVTSYFLFGHASLLGAFESFLTAMGLALAAWAGVFVVAPLYRHAKEQASKEKQAFLAGTPFFHWQSVASWIVGVMTGMLFSNFGVYVGPLAKGPFYQSGLGVCLAFFVSLMSRWVFSLRQKRQALFDNDL